MIPKVIHYIWLGKGPSSRLNMSCRYSWRRVSPSFAIKEWNEDNLPLAKLASENEFFARCLKLKAWAFVSDYLRLYILYNYGGVYLDTDVELVKDLTPLLDHPMFVGLENNNFISTSVIGAEPYNESIKRLLTFYDEEIWNVNFANNPIIFKYLMKAEPQNFTNCKVFPKEYFSPFNPSELANSPSLFEVSEDTYSMHWYSGNWNETLASYLFLNTKHIENPLLRHLSRARKTIGYIRRKWFR